VKAFRSHLLEYVIEPARAAGKEPTVFLTTAWLLSGNVIVDLMHKFAPEVRLTLVHVDTLHEFHEAHKCGQAMAAKYNVNIKTYRPQGCETLEDFNALYGRWEYLTDSDYTEHSKLEPYRRALHDMTGTVKITGRRRDQGGIRSDMPLWEPEKATINPLVDWSWDEITDYVVNERVPYNDLHAAVYLAKKELPHARRVVHSEMVQLDKPYFAYTKEFLRDLAPYVYVWKSFGDVHTSAPVLLDDGERAGRFFDDPSKTECGIHLIDAALTLKPQAVFEKELFGGAVPAVGFSTAVEEPAFAQLAPFSPQRQKSSFAHSIQFGVDGVLAACHAMYGMSDVIMCYPATSGSDVYPGSDTVRWSQQGYQNASGKGVSAHAFATRPNCGEAVHGAARTNATSVASILTADSLKYFVPSMHKIRRANQACVLHVLLRATDQKMRVREDSEALALARRTGFAVLHSNTVQEAHDMAVAAHLIAQAVRLPVLHGASSYTESACAPAYLARYATLRDLANTALAAPAPSLSPNTPEVTSAAIQAVFSAVSSAFGRRYDPFEYVGHEFPEAVFVASGLQAALVSEVVSTLSTHGYPVGLVHVRMPRPWLQDCFAGAFPSCARKVVVLEADPHAATPPLMQDVTVALRALVESGRALRAKVQMEKDVPSIDVFSRLRAGPRMVPSNQLTPLDVLRFHRTDAILALLGYSGGTSVGRAGLTAMPAVGSLTGRMGVLGLDDPQRLLTTIVKAVLAMPTLPPRARMEDYADYAPRAAAAWAPAAGSHALVCLPYTPAAHALARALAHTLATHHAGLRSMLHADRYADEAGVLLFHVFQGIAGDVAALASQHACTALLCSDAAFLARFDLLSRVHPGGSVTVANASEAELSLPAHILRTLADRRLTLRQVDVARASQDGPAVAVAAALLAAALVQATRLPADDSLALAKAAVTSSLAAIPFDTHAAVCAAVDAGASNAASVQLPVAAPPATDEEEPVAPAQPLAATLPLQDAPARAMSDQYVQLCKSLVFREAHGSARTLRAENGERTFQVTLTSSVRLTPTTYDRNVFHLEMDITGTGLTYRIGDALGVYGHNSDADVDAFLRMYGLDGDEVVPVEEEAAAAADDHLHVRYQTVRQLFVQSLDLFGRPAKAFYQDLAPYATDAGEQARLLHIASPAGKEDFKARVDATVTFADILEEFPSARPPLEDLIRMLPAIKPRHYSIASSMNMHPTSVHLLVVLVSWETPSGATRYGQCTRYLSSLIPGPSTKLTVSIKPSMMHLPDSPATPVVMAGLGTGMAPFRAFIEERAFQRAQGHAVGPVVLYFGSRHRAEEYLYGEELEAYAASGVLTHMGLAFSRDQEQKVYIQHKIEEDSQMLWDLLGRRDGHFYLCGPTWPVPEVKASLLHSFQACGGLTSEAADAALEEMKDAERYVLEVY